MCLCLIYELIQQGPVLDHTVDVKRTVLVFLQANDNSGIQRKHCFIQNFERTNKYKKMNLASLFQAISDLDHSPFTPSRYTEFALRVQPRKQNILYSEVGRIWNKISDSLLQNVKKKLLHSK